jgi:hypothetical protein
MSDPWECDRLTMAELGSPLEGVEPDSVSDLPEVQVAASLGWEPAHEAPLWCFLPAIWPARARAWVPDRRIRHSHVNRAGDVVVRRIPWSTATQAAIEADYHGLLAACGFPPRPFGRLWLLRPPPQWSSVEALLERVVDTWRESGGEVFADRRFAEHTRVVVDGAFAHED